MIGALYSGLTQLAGPLVPLVLARRQRRGKEDPARLPERLGHPGRARPAGPLVWIHAASVGESLSILPLIDAIVAWRPECACLVTSGTVTSADLLSARLPAAAFHQYIPVDRPGAVRRFLDHWRPDLAIWVESELWPNLVRATQRRGVKTALIQGRMSARSNARWRFARGLIGPLLEGFDLVLAQTRQDAARFAALGAGAVTVTGTLKYAAEPLPADEFELTSLRAAIGQRPAWLASSVHPGEFAAVVAAHELLRDRNASVLTMIVPRHPARAQELADRCRSAGLGHALRSRGLMPKADTAIYIADTIGELGLFYRLAGATFIGGSLIAHGGQNPIEPMQLGCPAIFGPSMYNFAEVLDDLTRAEAAVGIETAAQLADAVHNLLSDPTRHRALAAAQSQVVAAKAGVLDDVMTALRPLLPSE